MLRERRRHANFKPNRKLDQKSSRGMIYENEELRLRTININAEVERGQSDIKKLRRENDQLRKEIWSLRDEYDRLDKLLRTCRNEQRRSSDHLRDSDKCDSCNQSDDSISCDTCGDDDNHDEDQLDDNELIETTKRILDGTERINNNNNETIISKEKLHVNFDHLSIVSEENLLLSCDDILQTSQNDKSNLTDFQSIVPPLAHFENLKYEEIGPNLDSAGEVHYNSESTMTSDETVIPCEEWNFSKLNVPVLNSTIQQSHSLSQLKQEMTDSNSRCGPPDICLQNALASSSQLCDEPIYAEIKKPCIFQIGGNLEDLLQDIEHLSKDIMHMQYENSQKYRSQFDIADKNPDSLEDSNTISKTKPPYRSEMNLLLSFDGNAQTITTLQPDTTSTYQETPPPTLPHPMTLLPTTLPYAEFLDLKVTSSNADDTKECPVAQKRYERDAASIGSYREETAKEPLVLPSAVAMQASTLKAHSIPDAKKKSRRVSIYFNGKKTNEKLQKANQLANRTMPITSISGDSCNSSCLKKPHHHRKMSQESATIARVKNPRRHSDGTAYARHENNLIESVFTTNSTLTERNSFASSRDSSINLNLQKSRKISIGSHAGGKIPWCGCWGNGCL